MTDEAKALVERLRGDWPEILVEKHWMMDSDAIDKQREEAADLIETQAREIERLRDALVAKREETLWNAYRTGHVKDGLWSHLFMSDGEWLAQECGFDPAEYEYPDDEIRAAIPKVARTALGDSHDQ